MGRVYIVDSLDKEIVHVADGTEQDAARFCHTIQNGIWLKLMNNLFPEFSMYYF